ncbi:MAG: response regulator transcription factor [Nitrospirae bacterium]|nr:response regulator transcription factor [Nitrospirota bacterium]
MRKSILLVEDEAVVRQMLKGALETSYRILEAAKYSEAVSQLRNHMDLALIDYSLPDRDGFEVLKAIREVKPSLPAIMMTGYGCESVVIRALRAGVTDYIKKPLSFAYLTKRLAELLGTGPGAMLGADAVTREEFIMDGVAAYIDERYGEDLDLDRLARLVCMSRFSFSRAFKRRFGKSFVSYLNAVRVRKAAKLLDEPYLTVTEIAFSAGYENVAHFDRVFRAVYGLSPTEYRKRDQLNDP